MKRQNGFSLTPPICFKVVIFSIVLYVIMAKCVMLGWKIWRKVFRIVRLFTMQKFIIIRRRKIFFENWDSNVGVWESGDNLCQKKSAIKSKFALRRSQNHKNQKCHLVFLKARKLSFRWAIHSKFKYGYMFKSAQNCIYELELWEALSSDLFVYYKLYFLIYLLHSDMFCLSICNIISLLCLNNWLVGTRLFVSGRSLECFNCLLMSMGR